MDAGADLAQNQDNEASLEVYQRYKEIIQSSQDAIFTEDLAGLVTSWNRAAQQIFGYAEGEIVGKPVSLLYLPEQLPEFEILLDKIRRGERIEHFETSRRRKDGGTVFVSLSISPVHDAHGRLVGASKIATDISDRKQAEAQLAATQRENERLLSLFEGLLSSAPVGFALVDPSYRYVQVNHALAALHGIPAEEFIGRTVEEITPETWPQLAPIYQSVLSLEDDNIPREIRLVPRGQSHVERILLVRHYPVRVTNEVIGIGLVVFDLTEQRRIEKQLQGAQRMETIGNLTGGMAHDFNNLLGVIVINLELAQRRTTSADGDLAILIAEALEATWQGSELTKQLLAFARRQPLQPRRIDVNRLVTATMRLLARLLGEDIEVTLNPSADLWPIMVDPVQLETALVNFAANARDAMPAGGRLAIATMNRHLNEDYSATYSYVTPGDYVVIEICDTGIGMPPEVVDRIFEPFFTTKEAGKGTGLGLSMVFGFLKQSGGHVNVYSEIGIGTAFRLYLPRASGDAPVEEVIEIAEIAEGNGETVLVVEDNASVRRAVLQQLQELGYRTIEVQSASTALEILNTEPVDLLFTDIVMPGGLDGVELARIALERRPKLKVLLTSGFPEARIAAGHEGGSHLHLLSKPYPRDALARAVREVLDS